MNRSATPNSPKKRIDGEALMAIFLLALTVFLMFTVSVLIFRACTGEQSQRPNNGNVTTPPTNVITPPQNQNPFIFSGGSIVPFAVEDANTKTVSSEIDAFYAVLIDLQTGNIIAQKNSDLIFSPASIQAA